MNTEAWVIGFGGESTTNPPNLQFKTVNVSMPKAREHEREARSVSLGLSTCHTSPQSPFPPVHGKIIFPHSPDDVEDFGAFFSGCSVIDRPRANPPEVHRPKIVKARAVIAENGGVVRIVKERSAVVVTGASRGDARRGAVTIFSKASRRRLLRLLAKLDQKDRPIFGTITYPDEFPEGIEGQKKIKRDLDNLGKRFRRKFPNGVFIWKLEYVARKSGENAGKVAPHFHLLIWGASFADLKAWLSKAWYQVVGSEDEKHLRAGVRVEYLRSWRGVMYYASKYIAKIDEASVPEGAGRFWGVVGRDYLPLSGVVVIALTALQAIKATRLGAKYSTITGKNLQYGLTWLINGKAMVRYFEWFLDGLGFEGEAPYNNLFSEQKFVILPISRTLIRIIPHIAYNTNKYSLLPRN